jgi:hypothetical protein
MFRQGTGSSRDSREYSWFEPSGVGRHIEFYLGITILFAGVWLFSKSGHLVDALGWCLKRAN